MTKTKISISEAHEVMELYQKLTGEKIKDPDKLRQVHQLLQEYTKNKIKIHA